ncbi:hypothetical protein UFOVP573_108 [uncultured Caudovirales phage]|uniref:Uncharacterized protein n=1 Tax=uncultured Caudovirales phage TaxID=2100421 RepID=A0A6J5MYP9_9CAUD|nr:hypothetical protein UFOVP288_7 [uncultured Caudovirales phage]CAB4146070.1 hypothetical protein UFOVP483_32 [uncultured Caudovirales phage]CAB4151011.1 hypothetical protein UFOVP573_108 [uncultured Caudovirales phage]CAB4160634.1 hypothetical protein UFOVP769_7 [uncultured Caudovirales phage]CAB4175204.1 hypothetical protein UFOVP962_132 [uncultured Caudovirales phage]
MSDITTVQVTTTDVSNVAVTTDITVLSQSSGTINLASMSLATTVTDIARSGVVGVSVLAARADHVHSAADLLMDGGNY